MLIAVQVQWHMHLDPKLHWQHLAKQAHLNCRANMYYTPTLSTCEYRKAL